MTESRHAGTGEYDDNWTDLARWLAVKLLFLGLIAGVVALMPKNTSPPDKPLDFPIGQHGPNDDIYEDRKGVTVLWEDWKDSP